MIARGMQRGEVIGFFTAKMDDVTEGAAVIWGFEPMRDGVNAEGGTTRNAERTTTRRSIK